MSDGVRRLSDLPDGEARAELRACCGSSRWVERMLSQRPFKNRDEVFESAAHLWWQLGRQDWLEAFAAHPRIGEDATAGPTGGPTGGAALAARWSAAEQSQVSAAELVVKAALAEVNRAYEVRFGHVYIVCATGKSAEELLALARIRLGNDPDTELTVAAAEQAKITRLRLERLLTV